MNLKDYKVVKEIYDNMISFYRKTVELSYVGSVSEDSTIENYLKTTYPELDIDKFWNAYINWVSFDMERREQKTPKIEPALYIWMRLNNL